MKTVGIIGGMGTLATVDFFNKIAKNTDAKSDNEHLHILIDNNSNIPDRTAYILEGGTDPTDILVNSAKNLIKIGADFIVIPCNTAHFFYNRILEEIDVPMINMIEETAKIAHNKNLTTIGLLGTLGTYKINLYKSIFKQSGIDVIYPTKDEKIIVNNFIYDIKSENNYDDNDIISVIKSLKSNGAQAVILGCTELPVALNNLEIDVEILDPTLILAKSVIVFSGKKVKN